MVEHGLIDRTRPRWPVLALASIVLLAIALNLWVLAGAWIGGGDPGHRSLLIRELLLPRMATGLLAGGALGLAATLFQHALQNPLAEPTTLGISAGAYLALTGATLWAPWLFEAGREWVALLGAGLAMLAVFSLSGGAASTLTMIIAGLLVSLLCGALAALFVLLNHDYLTEIFIWQSGSLAQFGWSTPLRFTLALSTTTALAALLLRPLTLLELGDDSSRALGMPAGAIRWVVLSLATALSAIVVASVGVLGFVGLGAPALARMLGARLLAYRLVLASVFGALLLTLADAVVMLLPTAQPIPAGVATAALGAPLILFRLSKLRPSSPAGRQASLEASFETGQRSKQLLAGIFVLVAIGLMALLLGRGGDAWHGFRLDDFSSEFVTLRLPRVLAAAAAGGMLALAGTLLQRWTANPLASPEVLGISSGACLGVAALMLLMPGLDGAWLAAMGGASLALTCLVLIGRFGKFSSEHILLGGMALSVLSSAALAILMTKGDPRIGFLLSWMTGSTYRTTLAEAQLAAVIAFILLALSPLLARWLLIMPLGEPVERMLGVPLSAARILVLLFSAIATATATMIVGPLSFVGLLAPHLARQLGFRRPVEQLVAGTLLGAAIMVLADWLGRVAAYPWQIPSGLIATLVGGLLFVFLLAGSPATRGAGAITAGRARPAQDGDR